MKTLAALTLAAISFCLLGCPEEKAADSKGAASAAPTAAATASAAATAKPAESGGW